jgi:CheY-like chemotaxis protein
MFEGKVILVVDDDPTLLEMYVERIKSEGAIVVEARDGQEALERIAESRPSIIMLDVMMPRLNGFDVLSRIKSDPETANIPVIILTALSDDQKRRQGLELGAADFIVKAETLPIDVVEKIRKLISPEDISQAL